MKNFLKPLLKPNNLLLLLVFVLAIFVRFYNFPNRVTFWSEQARSLIVSGNYIKEKPTLLGQEYFRVDSRGHKMFSGAIFNYSLVPMLLIANYDPVVITSFFVILNLLTGVVLYVFVKRMVNQKVALASFVLFSFNDYMIYHSLFIWNYNYLPLIGVFTIYISYLNIKSKSAKYLLYLGLISGLGISLQVLYIPIMFFVLGINAYKKRLDFKGLVLFVLGLTIGNLPMVLFDLRHDFYHLRTISQYLVDTFVGRSDAGLAYYYFLPFWPLLAIIGGWLLSKLNNTSSLLFVLAYLYVNLSSPLISWNSPTGMPNGLTVYDIEMASSAISADANSEFNVSEVLDFDKRAYVIRYFVQFRNNKKILGDEVYNNLKLLYVLSQKDYNIEDSDIWEIKVGSPYKVSKLTDVGHGYMIYKLTK